MAADASLTNVTFFDGKEVSIIALSEAISNRALDDKKGAAIYNRLLLMTFQGIEAEEELPLLLEATNSEQVKVAYICNTLEEIQAIARKTKHRPVVIMLHHEGQYVAIVLTKASGKSQDNVTIIGRSEVVENVDLRNKLPFDAYITIDIPTNIAPIDEAVFLLDAALNIASATDELLLESRDSQFYSNLRNKYRNKAIQYSIQTFSDLVAILSNLEVNITSLEQNIGIGGDDLSRSSSSTSPNTDGDEAMARALQAKLNAANPNVGTTDDHDSFKIPADGLLENDQIDALIKHRLTLMGQTVHGIFEDQGAKTQPTSVYYAGAITMIRPPRADASGRGRELTLREQRTREEGITACGQQIGAYIEAAYASSNTPFLMIAGDRTHYATVFIIPKDENSFYCVIADNLYRFSRNAHIQEQVAQAMQLHSKEVEFIDRCVKLQGGERAYYKECTGNEGAYWTCGYGAVENGTSLVQAEIDKRLIPESSLPAGDITLREHPLGSNDHKHEYITITVRYQQELDLYAKIESKSESETDIVLPLWLQVRLGREDDELIIDEGYSVDSSVFLGSKAEIYMAIEPFLIAAERGERAILTKLIDSCIEDDIEVKKQVISYALIAACRNGQLVCARALLRKAEEVGISKEERRNMLLSAIAEVGLNPALSLNKNINMQHYLDQWLITLQLNDTDYQKLAEHMLRVPNPFILHSLPRYSLQNLAITDLIAKANDDPWDMSRRSKWLLNWLGELDAAEIDRNAILQAIKDNPASQYLFDLLFKRVEIFSAMNPDERVELLIDLIKHDNSPTAGVMLMAFLEQNQVASERFTAKNWEQIFNRARKIEDDITLTSAISYVSAIDDNKRLYHVDAFLHMVHDALTKGYAEEVRLLLQNIYFKKALVCQRFLPRNDQRLSESQIEAFGAFLERVIQSPARNEIWNENDFLDREQFVLPESLLFNVISALGGKNKAPVLYNLYMKSFEDPASATMSGGEDATPVSTRMSPNRITSAELVRLSQEAGFPRAEYGYMYTAPPHEVFLKEDGIFIQTTRGVEAVSVQLFNVISQQIEACCLQAINKNRARQVQENQDARMEDNREHQTPITKENAKMSKATTTPTRVTDTNNPSARSELPSPSGKSLIDSTTTTSIREEDTMLKELCDRAIAKGMQTRSFTGRKQHFYISVGEKEYRFNAMHVQSVNRTEDGRAKHKTLRSAKRKEMFDSFKMAIDKIDIAHMTEDSDVPTATQSTTKPVTSDNTGVDKQKGKSKKKKKAKKTDAAEVSTTYVDLSDTSEIVVETRKGSKNQNDNDTTAVVEEVDPRRLSLQIVNLENVINALVTYEQHLSSRYGIKSYQSFGYGKLLGEIEGKIVFLKDGVFSELIQNDDGKGIYTPIDPKEIPAIYATCSDIVANILQENAGVVDQNVKEAYDQMCVQKRASITTSSDVDDIGDIPGPLNSSDFSSSSSSLAQRHTDGPRSGGFASSFDRTAPTPNGFRPLNNGTGTVEFRG